jgi:internalin A
MTRDEAMRRIDRTAQENWTKLNLSGLDLEEVPSEIGKCTQLETFVLMESQFMAFHEKRKERGKRLTKFSDAVLQLTNLKILNLHDNQITSIPETIGQLSNLTWLDLGHNQIAKVPETIGQMSNLTQLDRASQSDNQSPRCNRATVGSDTPLPR